jgi:hypothetical protein
VFLGVEPVKLERSTNELRPRSAASARRFVGSSEIDSSLVPARAAKSFRGLSGACPLAEWFEVYVRRDPASRVRSSALYQSYFGWATTRSATDILDIKALGAGLVARGFQEPKKSNGCMMWRGIRLQEGGQQCALLVKPHLGGD